MKRILQTVVLGSVLTAFSALAHHPAADIVDEEIYAMIDSMVADTPHADLVFADMGGGVTELTLTTRDLRSLENMIDDGLIDYASMLDGDVGVDIDFETNGSITTTITQQ